MEYLVTMTTQVPDGVSESAVAAMRAREAAHTAELARDGRVVRLWRPPLRSGERVHLQAIALLKKYFSSN